MSKESLTLNAIPFIRKQLHAFLIVLIIRKVVLSTNITLFTDSFLEKNSHLMFDKRIEIYQDQSLPSSLVFDIFIEILY